MSATIYIGIAARYATGIIGGFLVNGGVHNSVKSFKEGESVERLEGAIGLAMAVATYAVAAFTCSIYQGDMSNLIVANLQTLGITTAVSALLFSRGKYVITARVNDTDPWKVVGRVQQFNKTIFFSMLSTACVILHISTLIK